MSALSSHFKHSAVHRHIAPQNCVSRSGFDAKEYSGLKSNLGIILDSKNLRRMIRYANEAANEQFGMDATVSPTLSPSIATPVQFLQKWLPGFVEVITDARKIDEIIGITVAGEWHDEEVVQGVKEKLGAALPYGDYTNIPLASWNPNFERRSIVRFEQGMQVGILEEARAAQIQINDGSEKREECAISLEISRNYVGFYGYNSGLNRTYGFLNDPNLPAYQNFPNGAGGSPLWANKTFAEIQKDLRLMLSGLRTQSGDVIDPKTAQLTLALATSTIEYLSTTTDQGVSVQDWLDRNYKNVRIVSAPELIGANGGANVVYLFADRVKDSSTDGGQTFVQIVPAKFKVVGVAKEAKGYIEDYSNALAGVMCKRPWAVIRYSGN